MSIVRRTAHKQLSQPMSSVQERDPFALALRKMRPALRVQTHLSLVDRCAQEEYPEMNPYPRENEHGRVGVAVAQIPTDYNLSIERDSPSHPAAIPELAYKNPARKPTSKAKGISNLSTGDFPPRSAYLYGDYSYIYDMYLE